MPIRSTEFYSSAVKLIFCIICLLISCSTEKRTTESRPNILLIMADDMGFSDLGCYGSEISTPNLDRLALEGIRFTQFYNASRCCPTRASLLTGLYPHQAGMGGMVVMHPETNKSESYQGFLRNDCVTLAEVLKKTGYTTLMSGKWHVGEFPEVWPRKRGFDEYWGLISGAANYFDFTKPKNPQTKRIVVENDHQIREVDENFYMTDEITARAVQMLKDHPRDNFFQYVAYTAPHWPLHALPEDISRYRGNYLIGWDSLRQLRYRSMLENDIIDSAWKLSERDPEIPAWKKSRTGI